MIEDQNKLCRTCLHGRKRLRTVFEKVSGVSGVTYADMILKISNVKITEDNNIPVKICNLCRDKAKQAYEFVEMVERSDDELKSQPGIASKRIKFDNIHDIKIKMNIRDFKKENNNDQNGDMGFDFIKNNENLIFHNTLIKKVKIKSIHNLNYDQNKEGQLSVADFLNSFKCDDELDYNDCDFDIEAITNSFSETETDSDNCHSNKSKYKKKIKSRDDDQDYIPIQNKLRSKKTIGSYNKSKEKKVIEKTKRLTGKEKTLVKVIKPQFINDVKVLPYDGPRKSRLKKNNYDYVKKELCPYCGLYTKTLGKHLLQHTGEKNYKCNKCEKSYFTVGGLKKHEYAHGERNLKCDHCVAVFYDMSLLKSHLKSHNTERNLICNICNKSFKQKPALKRHMIRHNSVNKKYKCELCGMSFYENFGLNHHMRIHTGHRPYKCEICNQPYSYKRDFTRHCLKKHGIFFKNRSENVLNEQVIERERALMKDLLLITKGKVKEGELINPFKGPQAAQSFHAAIDALRHNIIPIDNIIDD